MRAGKCHEREDENAVSDIAEEIAEPKLTASSAQNAVLPQRLRLRAFGRCRARNRQRPRRRRRRAIGRRSLAPLQFSIQQQQARAMYQERAIARRNRPDRQLKGGQLDPKCRQARPGSAGSRRLRGKCPRRRTARYCRSPPTSPSRALWSPRRVRHVPSPQRRAPSARPAGGRSADGLRRRSARAPPRSAEIRDK